MIYVVANETEIKNVFTDATLAFNYLDACKDPSLVLTRKEVMTELPDIETLEFLSFKYMNGREMEEQFEVESIVGSTERYEDLIEFTLHREDAGVNRRGKPVGTWMICGRMIAGVDDENLALMLCRDLYDDIKTQEDWGQSEKEIGERIYSKIEEMFERNEEE